MKINIAGEAYKVHFNIQQPTPTYSSNGGDDYQAATHGKVIAILTSPEAPEIILMQKASQCSKEDHFHPTIGRKYALQRVLKAFNTTKEERKAIWDAFREKYKQPKPSLQSQLNAERNENKRLRKLLEDTSDGLTAQLRFATGTPTIPLQEVMEELVLSDTITPAKQAKINRGY